MTTGARLLVTLVGLALTAAACSSSVPPPETPSAAEQVAAQATTTSVGASTSTATALATTSTTATAPPTTVGEPAVEIPLRLVRHTDDDATADFEASARATLTDPNGWEQAGFRFTFSPDAPYTVLLAEPAEVDATCAPYVVHGTYSCQIGEIVALNADRWRTATPTWTGSLREYQTMLVNHEVGHLLGQHHPSDPCPSSGAPAPLMAQQSKGLGGCLPNPWPLDWELACAARHVDPIAPPYDPDAAATCGP